MEIKDKGKSATEIKWHENDCCQTPEGRAKPTIGLSVTIGGGGSELLIEINPQHACGILNTAITVSLESDSGKIWVFTSDNTIRPPKTTWAWGPNEDHQLPEPIGPEIAVEAMAISTCGTADIENRTIRRY